MLILPALLALVVIHPAVHAVKRGDFKTCDQSGFCRRNRALADRAGAASATWTTPYAVDSPSFAHGILRARVSNALFPDIKFALEVRFQEDGVARILMDEVDGLRQRYNEAGMWAVQTDPVLETNDGAYKVSIGKGETSVVYAGGKHELKIQHSPVLLTFLRDGQPHIVLNERGLLNMEHFRIKSIGADEEELVIQEGESADVKTVTKEDAFPGFLPTDEDGMWEESFAGNTDSKPKGPESLSLDITFVGYEHVYGIPQHASSLSLKQTR
jgi:alpha 1,3-glucosidase